MAVLCTLFISCEKQELVTNVNQEWSLTSRSVENNISVVFTPDTGGDTTLVCTHAEVFYENPSSALIVLEFIDGTAYSGYGNDIFVTAKEGHVLEVVADASHPFQLFDLQISVCDGILCYSDHDESVSGTASGFIIEDDPVGV